MKRLLITVTLAIVLVLSTCLCASAATKLTVDGQTKDVVAYNIKGNNYFKLRDIANLLNGTNAQFDVLWDAEKQAINLKSKTAYSTKDSISLAEIKDPVATGSTSVIYKDGGKILAGAYNISGNNYFKLRDIAAIFNFAVVWDNVTQTIGIDTSKPYEFPAATSEFALNPELISYIGKTKAEMDALFGEPTPIMKDVYSFSGISKGLGGDIYSNGITVSYSAKDELKIVEKVEAPLSMMFYNCPETVTRPILDKIFFETNIGEEWDFKANVYGGTLEVSVKGGSTTSSGVATLSKYEYPTEMTEVVYVGKEQSNTATKNQARLYKEYFHKEYTTGMFSKDSDPWPLFDYFDFNKDGVAEVVAYCRGDAGYTRSYAGTYFAVYTIINNKVTCIYKLGDKENISTYTQPGESEYHSKIARFVDEQTTQFYTLDVKTGKLTLYSTIKVVPNEDFSQYRIWLNGKELTYDTEEYHAAWLNHSFNYPFTVGEDYYTEITMDRLTK